MNDQTRYSDRRRLAIEQAAYELLAQEGYTATSMLAIARRAKASNETLYKWYGNKQGLFRSLVEDNARQTMIAIQRVLDAATERDLERTLVDIGTVLLTHMTSEKAVALNRAAAGDVHDTGSLGESLAQYGRDSVLALIANLFARNRKAGIVHYEDGEPVAEIWFNLLIGDQQISRAIGARDVPSEAEIARNAQRAAVLAIRLFAAR